MPYVLSRVLGGSYLRTTKTFTIQMRKLLLCFFTMATCSTWITACGSTDDYIEDLVIRTDTIYSNDTIIHTDTTFLNGDTIIQFDTIVKKDTLIHNDTLKRSDIIISYFMDQIEGSTSVQGADIYKHYLFQFQHTNSKVFIYNLEEKRQIGIVTLKVVPNNHCNSVSFSNIFFEKTDFFPLLYVSGSSSGTYNHVQVYRILKENENFSIAKIQEITLPNNLTWSGAVIDKENNYMYVYANTKGAQIAKFNIPDINNQNVILTDNEILETFILPSFTHQQGACIKDSLLYIMEGVPGWGDINYLRIIDLNNKQEFRKINLSELGYGRVEFESISTYNDGFILTTNNNCGIYSLIINSRNE